jgi:hypothetical protein
VLIDGSCPQSSVDRVENRPFEQEKPVCDKFSSNKFVLIDDSSQQQDHSAQFKMPPVLAAPFAPLPPSGPRDFLSNALLDFLTGRISSEEYNLKLSTKYKPSKKPRPRHQDHKGVTTDLLPGPAPSIDDDDASPKPLSSPAGIYHKNDVPGTTAKSVTAADSSDHDSAVSGDEKDGDYVSPGAYTNRGGCKKRKPRDNSSALSFDGGHISQGAKSNVDTNGGGGKKTKLDDNDGGYISPSANTNCGGGKKRKFDDDDSFIDLSAQKAKKAKVDNNCSPKVPSTQKAKQVKSKARKLPLSPSASIDSKGSGNSPSNSSSAASSSTTPATSPEPTYTTGKWKPEEEEHMYAVLKAYQEEEKALGHKEPILRDIPLYKEISRRLRDFGVTRPANGCKNYWVRFGRAKYKWNEKTGVEDVNAQPTSVQVPKRNPTKTE